MDDNKKLQFIGNIYFLNKINIITINTLVGQFRIRFVKHVEDFAVSITTFVSSIAT